MESDAPQSDLSWCQRTRVNAAAPPPSNSTKVLKGLRWAPERDRDHVILSRVVGVKTLSSACAIFVCLFVQLLLLSRATLKEGNHLWRGNSTNRRRKEEEVRYFSGNADIPWMVCHIKVCIHCLTYMYVYICMHTGLWWMYMYYAVPGS